MADPQIEAARSIPSDAAPLRRNIRLLVEYDGARYRGWQMQEGLPTVQETLQQAIFAMTGHAPSLRVAGRTDAGVHAVAQVTNFRTPSSVALYKFAPGLNRHLPDDISVHQAEEVPYEWDARSDSQSKRYRYRIYQGSQPAALAQHAWHRRQSLQLDAMREAAQHLVGHHDFDAFRSIHCDAPHAVREIFSIDIIHAPRPPQGSIVDIIFFGDSFCRHMCRIIAGTLVEVGMGKRPAGNLREVLASRDRTKAGVTAPPGGLTLLEVHYERPWPEPTLR